VLAVRRRVERLEEKLGGCKRIVMLFANDGESARECVVRNGHDPDRSEITYIVVVWETGDQYL